jgi:hypothetical protein
MYKSEKICRAIVVRYTKLEEYNEYLSKYTKIATRLILPRFISKQEKGQVKGNLYIAMLSSKV